MWRFRLWLVVSVQLDPVDCSKLQLLGLHMSSRQPVSNTGIDESLHDSQLACLSAHVLQCLSDVCRSHAVPQAPSIFAWCTWLSMWQSQHCPGCSAGPFGDHQWLGSWLSPSLTSSHHFQPSLLQRYIRLACMQPPVWSLARQCSNMPG